jgi:hypothetical protein
MPYGASHGHVHKETNSQPQGRKDSKTNMNMGPAVPGNVKPNVSMKSSGLGRSVRGPVAPGTGSKMASNKYVRSAYKSQPPKGAQS